MKILIDIFQNLRLLTEHKFTKGLLMIIIYKRKYSIFFIFENFLKICKCTINFILDKVATIL